ncbi:MAG: hypothetical protein IKA23_00545 [Akkermansia sp.]|nr:hypothetical protein [Akkermansia sp.]MBR2313670.1 hypothetical protein [Akkermansia sp.]
MFSVRSILPVLLACCLAACSVEQRIGDARRELMSEYNAIPDWEKLPQKQLSWEKALHLLETGNLDLQRCRNNIREAERQCERIFTDFIPIVDLGHYYSSALIKSDTSSPSYGSFDVNVIFNIPSLMRLPVDHYTRSLELYKARQDMALKKRELVAKLWQQFRSDDIAHRTIRTEEADAKWRESNQQIRRREQELQQREREQNLCALLNDYSARWSPVPGTMPRLQWSDYREKADTPDELTQITMALTLEVARLQKLGVAVRYLPDFNVNFFSPSLFSSTGGSTGGFMSGDTDVRVNLNTYLQLDTRLEIWSEWARAKENYHLVQQELTHNMHEYRNKMKLLLDSWKTYDDWLLSTQAYVRFRQTQGGLTPDELSSLYEEDLALQQEMLDQESKNVERECALIQEYGLPADNSTPASVFNYPNRMNHTIVEQGPRGCGGPDSTFKKTSNPQLNSYLTS